MTKAAAAVGTAMTATVVVSVTINFLLSASLSFLWGMLNTLQLIVHLPLFSIVFPSNAVTFYSYIIGIASFNIFPIEDIA